MKEHTHTEIERVNISHEIIVPDRNDLGEVLQIARHDCDGEGEA
jgi:hypothetical protein